MIQFSQENHWTCRGANFETFPNHLVPILFVWLGHRWPTPSGHDFNFFHIIEEFTSCHMADRIVLTSLSSGKCCDLMGLVVPFWLKF